MLNLSFMRWPPRFMTTMLLEKLGQQKASARGGQGERRGRGTESGKGTVSRCQYSVSEHSRSSPIGSRGSCIAFML